MEVALEAVNEVNPQEFYQKALLENRSSSHFRQILNLKEKKELQVQATLTQIQT